MTRNITFNKLILLVITILLIFGMTLVSAQTPLYNETFSVSNGTTSTSNWSSNNVDSSWWSPFDVNNNQMRSFLSLGEDVWTSASIDITNYTNLNISLDASETGNLSGSDYIKVYYTLDGGSEVLIQSISDDFDTTSISLSNLTNNGNSSLVIIVKLRNDGWNSHYFDNVKVTGEEQITGGNNLFKNDITTNNAQNFNPYTTNQVFDSNITVSGISRGSGVNAKNKNGMYNAKSWDSPSFDANDYYEFTLTANLGYEINFTGFTYTSAVSSGDNIGNIVVRTSLDNFTTNIATPNANGATIVLTSSSYQGVSNPITFRIYAWGGNRKNAEFGIDDFAFTGTISQYALWNNAVWVNGVQPSVSVKTVIDADYNTSAQGSFSASKLIVKSGYTLTVDNETYVEVANNVTVNGNLIVETKGAFVQINDTATFTGTGTVNKTTANKNAWYYYTYWGSPVSNMTVASAFPNVASSRRFFFNAANFLDADNDGFDDDYNDWTIANGSSTMTPGVGYAATSSSSSTFPGPDYVSFVGTFNTGTITTPIAYTGDVTSADHPNLLGNPYASAIDYNDFYNANSTVIEGVAYFWSQATPANGNGKFSQNDYATYSVGMGAGVAGASGVIPNEFVPSGQGFFATAKTNGTASFTNSMRVKGTTDNSRFFKTSTTKNTTSTTNSNKLWLNLTSDNGVFSQLLVGYVDGATNANDGLLFDAPKLESGEASLLYTTIENSSKRFVIQGKDVNSLSLDEVITLGFKTKITEATLYTISIAQLKGDFLNGNTIYLKDKVLNTINDLSTNDYTFTSEVGEFNDRFEIVFKSATLSTETTTMEANTVKVFQNSQNDITFKVASNNIIKTIVIYDLQGQMLYQLKGDKNEETYNLPKLNNSVFLSQIELSNGIIFTKKSVIR